MRIQVLSDLHAELDARRAKSDVVDLGADLVVLAGDIDQGDAGVRWAAEMWPDTPVVYVVGNHEHYGARIGEATERSRRAAAGTNVHVLERESVTIDGVRILGATLWTNLNLAGDPAWARWRLAQALTDYQAILGPQRRLRPRDTQMLHALTVAWLDDLLEAPHEGPTIVVTHHAPSPRSLMRRQQAPDESPWTAMDAAFASDLEWLITEFAPALWIHGHTHRSCDYRIGGTRVVSNQRGYYGETTGWDPALVLEVQT
jgi:Icc-related predicted phosphoesterase